MRESFGGAFMFKLIIIFIVIYVSFMAVAINYAKAFRVKNEVIDILEQNQYNGTSSDPAIALVDQYLPTVGYNYGSSDRLRAHCASESEIAGGSVFTDYGACIVTKGTENNRYYKVITYIYIEMPFFQLNMTIPISGETKIIR